MKNILFLLAFFIFGCEMAVEEEVPAAPTELIATAVSKGQVDLYWQDNSPNEIGFKVERKTGSGNFTEIGISASNTAKFSDKTVTLNTTYTYRVISVNKLGNAAAYSNESSVKSIDFPKLTTAPLTEITAHGVKTGGSITSDGNSSIIANGVVWSTAIDPTVDLTTKTSNGNLTGLFESPVSGLVPGTKYYLRAYATNTAGTSYGNQLIFTTSTVPAFTFSTVVGANDKVWMDRNLGAAQVATSSTDAASYGDLYQWGRGADGHQIRTSATTSTSSGIDQPSTNAFITAANAPFDWRSPQNPILWQGLTGVNNPCPTGFRLPTEEEWKIERASWISNNSDGAFASILKLPLAGYRTSSNAALTNVGIYGLYWSSSISNTGSRDMLFYVDNANMGPSFRADGASVRCIKD